MPDLIIVGNGPAGISAAIYAVRAGLDVLVIGRDSGALEKADKIENYYGFENPVSGQQLLNNGLAQARRLGAEILQAEVTSIGFNGEYAITTTASQHKANAVILATGTQRSKPNIAGLNDFEGRGVSYCATCDAFFYKGKNVAVFGGGEYAVNEAKELLPVAASVAMLTGGNATTAEVPAGVTVYTNKINRLTGDGPLSGVVFENGETLNVYGLFIAVGVAGSADLAKKLGAETNGTKVVVDENMATNLPGLFAAGDCTGGLLQVVKAASDGAKAGTSAVKYIRSLS